MSKERILVVDDEEDILELIQYNLERENFRVTCVKTGEAALARIHKTAPDMIILDLMLPGIDGMEVCRRLKRDVRTARIPVLMLTAKGEDSDIISGLELGADDYVTKPFSPKVLIARVRAAIRRQAQEQLSTPETIQVHDLEIRPARREVTFQEQAVDLTATEFDILLFLTRKPGWVFSRDQIISAVKGADYPVTERSIDVQIVSLRKKLGEGGSYIQTVRGVGYRFREQP